MKEWIRGLRVGDLVKWNNHPWIKQYDWKICYATGPFLVEGIRKIPGNSGISENESNRFLELRDIPTGKSIGESYGNRKRVVNTKFLKLYSSRSRPIDRLRGLLQWTSR